jgi:excisionase family DNA binding protein
LAFSYLQHTNLLEEIMRSSPLARTDAPRFFDVAEVAWMFQMSRMTVYRAIRSGDLPAVRIRGRWLVPARVIEALVKSAEAAVPIRATPPDSMSPLTEAVSR